MDSCLEELRLAVTLGVWTQSDQQRRTAEQQDRKKQMVFSKHWMDNVWKTARVSLAAQQPKISKTLLCWYIDTCIYWQVFLDGNNVSLDRILFHLCATSSLDGRQVGLAPYWTSGSGNSWPGQGGGKHCYLNAAGRKSWQRNRKHGWGTAIIDWKIFLGPAQVHREQTWPESYWNMLIQSWP